MCLCVDADDLEDDNDSSDDGSDDDSSSSSSHLSILLFLMKGPHDDAGLTWPLKGEFEVKLLNQVSDSDHHSETVYFDDDTPSEATYRVMDDYQATKGLEMTNLSLVKIFTMPVHHVST